MVNSASVFYLSVLGSIWNSSSVYHSYHLRRIFNLDVFSNRRTPPALIRDLLMKYEPYQSDKKQVLTSLAHQSLEYNVSGEDDELVVSVRVIVVYITLRAF